jgi:Ceramidase
VSAGATVFVYCERGVDPGFFAEPLNAVTNLAFVIAGGLILAHLLRGPAGTSRVIPIVLAVLAALIGIGSFLFHTMATRWAGLADVLPILIFMVVYVGFATRVLLGLPIAWSVGVSLGYLAAIWAAGQIRCGVDGFIPVGLVGQRCWNGSIAYLPALLALLAVGGVLAYRHQPAGKVLLAAAGVFAVSLIFRSLDREMCPYTAIVGHQLGTHFVWHLLNALTLYIVMRTTIPRIDAD